MATGLEPGITSAGGPLGERAEVAVTVDSAALKLREGEGMLVVRARDDFWRPLTIDERPLATLMVTLDLTPPQLEILAATRYVSEGRSRGMTPSPRRPDVYSNAVDGAQL